MSYILYYIQMASMNFLNKSVHSWHFKIKRKFSDEIRHDCYTYVVDSALL